MSEEEIRQEEEMRQEYLKVWSAIFKEFRGWSSEQTLEWAIRKGHLGAGRDYWTFHDPIPRPVVWELFSPDLVEQVRRLDRIMDLESDAERALWPRQYDLERRDPADADWGSIRRNFEQVIARYTGLVRPEASDAAE